MARLSQLCIALFVHIIATYFGCKGPSSGITLTFRENYFVATLNKIPYQESDLIPSHLGVL